MSLPKGMGRAWNGQIYGITMKCNDINIPQCLACSNIIGTECWIELFGEKFQRPYWTPDKVKKDFILTCHTNLNNAGFYIYHAIKHYRPELLPVLDKVAIL